MNFIFASIVSKKVRLYTMVWVKLTLNSDFMTVSQLMLCHCEICCISLLLLLFNYIFTEHWCENTSTGLPVVLKFLKFHSCPEIVLKLEIVLKFYSFGQNVLKLTFVMLS